MNKIAVLCVSVWLGMQVGFGYVVTPILFSHLDKQVAGQLAGYLFHVSHYWGLLAWGGAWLVLRQQAVWVNRLVLILLALFAVSEFLVTPTITALKVDGTTLLLKMFGGSFGVWHGVSSVFYLLQTLLGLGLLIKFLKFNV